MNPLSEQLRLVVADAPPTRVDLDQLIATDQRRRIRARRLTVVGVAAAVVTLVPTVLAVTGQPDRPDPALARPATTTPGAAEATAQPPPGQQPAATPARRPIPSLVAWQHRVSSRLAATMPAGAEFAPVGGETSRPAPGSAGQVAVASLFGDVRTADDPSGQVTVALVIDGEPQPEDPCLGRTAAHPDSGYAGFDTGYELRCEVVMVGDVPVRVATAAAVLPWLHPADPAARYQRYVATRYGDGWFVLVYETPYREYDLGNGDAVRPRDTPVLDPATLAALAAHPDLVP